YSDDPYVVTRDAAIAATAVATSGIDDEGDDDRGILSSLGDPKDGMMQKILSQLNQLKAKPDDEDINLKFLRALPSSWSQSILDDHVADFHYMDDAKDIWNAVKASGRKKMSYGDSPSYSSSTTYSAPLNSKTRSHKSSNVIEDVLQSFVTDTELEQQLAYEDFEQIKKLDLEEMDLKWQIAMLYVRVHRFKQKAGRKIDFDKKESASDGVIASKKFGMIAGCDTEDALKEGAAKIYNLITEAGTKEASTAEKWRNSSKNLFRLIDSSMSIRTKVGLGFNNYIRENELGWDGSTFSVFTTNSEDVEGRPLFNRFAKADSMKAMPLPLSGDYTSLSDHIDLVESQMPYGTNSSTFSDSKSVSNDFVSYDDSDKPLEVNTNDFTSSDSSVISSEPKPNDSTSYASTSSVSTSVNEAEIESNCTYLIKDCDFYEKQMVNKTVDIRVNIHPARPQLVPTGKPKVFPPVPIGRPNRPFPVPTDRGYSPS
nr:ribonuclease H-like domain-containing protein [Tanacetum cinerariifolium]